MHNFLFIIDTIYVFDLIIILIDPIVEGEKSNYTSVLILF
jgi:hypothetical protein